MSDLVHPDGTVRVLTTEELRCHPLIAAARPGTRQRRWLRERAAAERREAERTLASLRSVTHAEVKRQVARQMTGWDG